MSEPQLPQRLSGVAVHMVGIKGTGMSALAEILLGRGARITGSDTAETFYTDEILRRLGIPFREGFAASNLPEDTEVVVYSAAYDPDSHPELTAAREKHIPVIVYTDALGSLSQHWFSVAVSGVHGKSSTTALAGALVKSMELPGTVLVGTAVRDFGRRSTLMQGDEFFIAETCEYRRHFLAFHPSVVVITNVEADHLDYFADVDDVRLAFRELVARLPEGGRLIYCADDEGARSVADYAVSHRPDIRRTEYGREAQGPFRLLSYSASGGVGRFRLAGILGELRLALPGEHLALNAAAAIAAVGSAMSRGEEPSDALSVMEADRINEALSTFSGLARRSEVIGRAGDILFMDDYGHHPTEIRCTLRGVREFYQPRRLVVDFMSHTYTRTEALLAEFATCFADADEVVLHQIYPSAREKYTGTIDGRDLSDAVAAHHPSVRYFEEVMDAAPYLLERLHAGDLFLTMGAGNNWKLSHTLFRELAT